jgi:hypothetical protein
MNKEDAFIEACTAAFLSASSQADIQAAAQKVYNNFITELSFQLNLEGKPIYNDVVQASQVLMNVRHRLKALDHLLPPEIAGRVS